MQMTVHGKKHATNYQTGTACFFLCLFLVFSQMGFSQNLTLSFKKISLETAFRAIEAKVTQRFVYTSEMLAQSRPVTLQVTDAPLDKTLALLFKNQPFDYSVDNQFITVRFKTSGASVSNSTIDVQGTVWDMAGQPLPRVTVSEPKSGKSTATDNAGTFMLRGIQPTDLLSISSIGYMEKTIAVDNRTSIAVHLEVAYASLDETVVMAYGTTTRRLNTGNISRVTAEEIGKQPVSNPFGALYGRVPGLVIRQSNGLPGSSFSLQIRGRNSITQGSEPLIIVDGVPLASGNSPINLIASAVGSGGTDGMSALSTFNPSDIESIEVLKDADATAIYGSRGANGVILITTKKGRAGETKCDVRFYSGISRITRTMNMLNTREYVQMRTEGLANEGLTPDESVAPDLVAWDTTRYTDFKKLLIGNTAHTNDVQLNFSGGTTTTQFLLGAGYHKETTVFPGDLGQHRISVHSNMAHTSVDKRFSLNLSAACGADKSNLIGTDLSAYLNLPPNLLLYDSSYKLNWSENGVSFGLLGLTNPLALLRATYTGQFDNLLGNLQFGYNILPGLNLKTSVGYNSITGDEVSINPSASIDPARSLLPYSSFATSSQKSWIAEPQAEYSKQLGKGKLNVLIGGTWQEIINKGTSIYANDYTNDVLLASVSAAGTVIAQNSYTQYRYSAGFGRLNYRYGDKYILNLSGRRDGSSRFGPSNQLASFGAVGAAWVFSNESFLKKRPSFISFGKLRGSYGTTGNDQIGDYKFIETWINTTRPYQGIPGLRPTSLYNPNYGWETNRKIETALELAFFHDKVFLTAAYFTNRCGNQLVNYTLPIQTGFPSVAQNIGAKIRNSGMEWQVATNIKGSNRFIWTASLSLSLTRNKLLAFPGLDKTSYAQNYVIGKSLATRKTFEYMGVDAATGIYQFNDVNHDNVYDLADRVIFINTDPKYYGGFVNSFTFKSVELEFLLEFRRQQGLNYLFTQAEYLPGYYYFNQPEVVLNRWQKPGDNKNIQKFVATGESDAFIPGSEYLSGSNAVYSDASYIRLKNVSLSYHFTPAFLKRMHFSAASLYVQAQNLLTLTNYTGADPENQNLYALPPLKTITAGLQLSF